MEGKGKKDEDDLSVLESKYSDLPSIRSIGDLCLKVVTGHYKEHHEKNLKNAFLSELIPEELQQDFKSASDKAKPLFYEKYCQEIDIEAYFAAIKQLADSIESTLKEYDELFNEDIDEKILLEILDEKHEQLTKNPILNYLIAPKLVMQMIEQGSKSAMHAYLEKLDDQTVKHVRYIIMNYIHRYYRIHKLNALGIAQIDAYISLMEGNEKYLEMFFESNKFGRRKFNAIYHIASIQSPKKNDSESYELFKRCWKWTDFMVRNALMFILVNDKDLRSLKNHNMRQHILLFAQEAEGEQFKEIAQPSHSDKLKSSFAITYFIQSKKFPLLDKCLRTFDKDELDPKIIKRMYDLAIKEKSASTLLLLTKKFMEKEKDKVEEVANIDNSIDVIEEIPDEKILGKQDLDKLVANYPYKDNFGEDHNTSDALNELSSYAFKLPSEGDSKKDQQGRAKRETVVTALSNFIKSDDENKLKNLAQQLTDLLSSKPDSGIRVNRGSGAYVITGFFKGVKNPIDGRYSRSTTETRTILTYKALMASHPKCFKDAEAENKEVLEMM